MGEHLVLGIQNIRTLICDMDKRRILDILPSRNKDVVSNWLKGYPNIKLVSRDGSITYSAAITEALPEAKQVSHKFHLIKNLIEYINKYIRRKYPEEFKCIFKNSLKTLDTWTYRAKTLNISEPAYIFLCLSIPLTLLL